MQNRLELVEAYFAACRLVAIAVPVNFRLVADEVAYILDDPEVTALLVDHELAATAAAVRPRVRSSSTVVACGAAEATPGLDAEPYEQLLAGASDVEMSPLP
jgi:fatty-acyl-CoA synthase